MICFIDHSLIKIGAECLSEDQKLGRFLSLAKCADACRSKRDCKYFVYGKLDVVGYCYWEKTTSESCPEGFQNTNYDFYELRDGKFTLLD